MVDEIPIIQKLQAACLKMETALPSEIRVGSPLRFRQYLAKRSIPIEGREDRMIFGGVPVVCDVNIPENRAVMVQGGEIKAVINFDKPV